MDQLRKYAVWNAVAVARVLHTGPGLHTGYMVVPCTAWSHHSCTKPLRLVSAAAAAAALLAAASILRMHSWLGDVSFGVRDSSYSLPLTSPSTLVSRRSRRSRVTVIAA